MIKKFLTEIVVRRILRKPEIASLIEARLVSFSGFIRAALNMASFWLGMDRAFGLVALTAEVTNHCNLKCPMCPSNNGSIREKGFMTFEFLKKIVDDAPGIDYVQLYTWGEPFLNRDIFRMIEYIASKGIHAYTISNGTLLNDALIEKIVNSPLDRIAFSVDGTGEYYERVRGVKYEKTERNLKALIARRNEAGSKLKIELIMCVQKDNEENVEEFCAAWEGLVDRIQLQPQTYFLGEAGEIKRTRPCWQPWVGNLFVHWNGAVAPCCVDYNDELIVGDATRESLREILNGPRMRALRHALQKRQFGKYPLCERCVEYTTKRVGRRFE
jgi:MoaA/NifB/PqqE/SkfB family radical SAM enzyme